MRVIKHLKSGIKVLVVFALCLCIGEVVKAEEPQAPTETPIATIEPALEPEPSETPKPVKDKIIKLKKTIKLKHGKLTLIGKQKSVSKQFYLTKATFKFNKKTKLAKSTLKVYKGTKAVPKPYKYYNKKTKTFTFKNKGYFNFWARIKVNIGTTKEYLLTTWLQDYIPIKEWIETPLNKYKFKER